MRPTPAITRAPRYRYQRSRNPKKLILTAVCLLLAAVLICVFISIYVGWKLTHPEHKPLTEDPSRYQMSFEPVEFDSRTKDVTLKGWFIPSEAEPAKLNIVIAHGYRENRAYTAADTLELAKAFVAHGYNVLMFDFRNSGESGGNLTSVGYLEKYDLLGAIDWMQEHHPGKTVIHGFSMGATTALLAAADDPAVAAVVADSPFNHLTHYLEDNLPVWSHLPRFPFTPLILGILPKLTGINTDEVDGLSAVDRIYPRPILFIHSTDDQSIPYENSESMWKKHPDKFLFWKTSGADHARSHKSYPQPYEEKVIEFYDGLNGTE